VAGEEQQAAPKGVLAEIDRRLAQIERELEGHRALIAERDRLLKAKAALVGSAGQISRDDVAEYLAKHPGAKPAEIAKALGVSSGTVSAHLFRGKRSHFVSRGREWYVRDPAPSRGRR
jgi:DNA-binding MarR family transcriptional regulator